jgi:hypothetical protein
MGRGVTKHIGDHTLEQRGAMRAAEPLLTPVWVLDAGRHVAGVLLAWDRRQGSWWGLVAWDPGSGQERVWLHAGRLRPIESR